MIKPYKKTILFAVIIFSIFSSAILYFFYLQEKHRCVFEVFKCIKKENSTAVVDYQYYRHGNWRNLSKEQVNSLSELGKILFLEKEYPKVNTSTKNYTILNWEYGSATDARHIRRFTRTPFDPFENCSVDNCIISYNNLDIDIADLVLFEIYFICGPQELPPRPNNTNQIWTFVTEESPLNTYADYMLQCPSFDGYFNWSMTYRMDADIPFPYGRTVALTPEEEGKFDFDKWNKAKNQNVLITILGSHCHAKNSRWPYVQKLRKYISLHTFGECGENKCPGYYRKDCDLLSRYKFYLAFENSNCNEYITEKVWWNSFGKNAIPIIMGTTKRILNQTLPPNSYIHINDFVNPRRLAQYIIYLNNTPRELEKYLEWKNHFKVLNEHGYFQSKSELYCRACEALNYNSKKKKVYNNLNKYWFQNQCQTGWRTFLDINMIL
ncbi:hypothetical protein ILUMI_22744 [Ignelater luminosus]|uniref:Fucosyltransferase n=1 Tax=Ignelater luminosus TaxID=2038154 RepID=A0A8K0CA29_IGNLU|nr:hypothetical protein ILUMI_22744 [Ignelater luminosus]